MAIVHIWVLSNDGDTDPPSATVGTSDIIHWHPKNKNFKVSLDFGTKSPVKDKKPSASKGKVLIRQVTAIVVSPVQFNYGTPNHTQRAGTPDIIVDPGTGAPGPKKKGGARKRGKKKAGKKR